MNVGIFIFFFFYSQIHRVQFAESPPTVPRKAVLAATELAQRLDANGRVQAYGVVFDTQGALDPSSKDAVDEIGALLNQRPHLKLHIVGHSDNVGSPAANREISKRRAHAVCVVLVSEYGISRERLTANGVGSLAPLTSNGSEVGRARNRRIELVVQ
jgi:outer membrane protein OmpA-like peptidoglycan-associated protein